MIMAKAAPGGASEQSKSIKKTYTFCNNVVMLLHFVTVFVGMIAPAVGTHAQQPEFIVESGQGGRRRTRGACIPSVSDKGVECSCVGNQLWCEDTIDNHLFSFEGETFVGAPPLEGQLKYLVKTEIRKFFFYRRTNGMFSRTTDPTSLVAGKEYEEVLARTFKLDCDYTNYIEACGLDWEVAVQTFRRNCAVVGYAVLRVRISDANPAQMCQPEMEHVPYVPTPSPPPTDTPSESPSTPVPSPPPTDTPSESPSSSLAPTGGGGGGDETPSEAPTEGGDLPDSGSEPQRRLYHGCWVPPLLFVLMMHALL